MPSYTVECEKCGQKRDIFRNLSEFGNWPECHGKMRQIIAAPQIIADIQPYRAVASDVATGRPPVIGSRREHKEFLKRNGYVEVGNETPKPKKPEINTASRQDIKRAWDQVRSRSK